MRTRTIGTFVLLALIICVMFAVRPSKAGAGGKGGQKFRPTQIIVSMIPGGKIDRLNGRHGTRVVDRIEGTDPYLLELPRGAGVSEKLAGLTSESELLVAGPNFDYQAPEVLQTSQAFIDQTSQAFIDQTSQAFIDAGVPVSYTSQPAVSALHLKEAQSYTMGQGVKVAVIDTGLDFQHPLFAGRIGWPVHDFVDGDEDPTDVGPGVGYGHGTFVAGLIALAAPRATIMPLRAFGSDGFGTSFNIAKAIRYAADNGARVINMSFGMAEEDPLVKDAIVYASQRTYMVAAAGNDNANSIHFPASLGARTLSVTSTANNDVKAPFSNFDPNMNVSAPGVSVYSAYPGKAWAYWSGTSFSTALVSGEAALLLSLKPESTRTDLNGVIKGSGTNIDPVNPDHARQLGRVRIDYEAAVLKQLNLR